jgi:hypothetical protein
MILGLPKDQASLKARCDFAYSSFFVLGTGFLVSSLLADWEVRTHPDDIAGWAFIGLVTSIAANIILSLAFPVIGAIAGFMARLHLPALLLGFLCLFGILFALNDHYELLRLLAAAAIATSTWWFLAGRWKA